VNVNDLALSQLSDSWHSLKDTRISTRPKAFPINRHASRSTATMLSSDDVIFKSGWCVRSWCSSLLPDEFHSILAAKLHPQKVMVNREPRAAPAALWQGVKQRIFETSLK
jgi:hypothetical protein